MISRSRPLSTPSSSTIASSESTRRTRSRLRSLFLSPTKRRGSNASPRSKIDCETWPGKLSTKATRARLVLWTTCFHRVEDHSAILGSVCRSARPGEIGREGSLPAVSEQSSPPEFALQESGRRGPDLLRADPPRLPRSWGHEGKHGRLVLDRKSCRLRPKGVK